MPGKALSAAYELQVAAPKSGAEQLRHKCGDRLPSVILASPAVRNTSLRMAESKSDQFPNKFNAHFEKIAKFDLSFPMIAGK